MKYLPTISFPYNYNGTALNNIVITDSCDNALLSYNTEAKYCLLTGWYVSLPQVSQVYVATINIGLTSVALVTIPFTHTNFPILSALTSRMDACLCIDGVLK